MKRVIEVAAVLSLAGVVILFAQLYKMKGTLERIDWFFGELAQGSQGENSGAKTEVPQTLKVESTVAKKADTEKDKYALALAALKRQQTMGTCTSLSSASGNPGQPIIMQGGVLNWSTGDDLERMREMSEKMRRTLGKAEEAGYVPAPKSAPSSPIPPPM